MDVSNSTGQETGYRVVGAGGTKPDPKKAKELKEGDIITLNKTRLIKLKGAFWEILAEDILDPWTYDTVKPFKGSPALVQFHRKNASICICDVNPQSVELLIAVTENGKSTAGKSTAGSTAEAYVCRRKKI